MRSEYEQQDPLKSSGYQELQLLSKVDETPDVTQRQLSFKVGTALGLTNVMLRNMVEKGYIRVTQATWKRRLYSLTPEGFAHKLRLTIAYIHRVLDHYQEVRQAMREQMETLAVNEESRVAIYGTSEFAELVFLGLREIGIEEIEVFARGSAVGGRFLGMPVHDVAGIRSQEYDRVVVALLADSEEALTELSAQGVPEHKVVSIFAGTNGRKQK